MVIDKIISLFSDYLEIDTDEISESTMLFLEYDLSDEDVEDIVEMLNDEFDIEIDIDEFCELSTLEEVAEYVESLM
jgi:acyl carrier protein